MWGWSAITIQRKTAAGALVEGHRHRWNVLNYFGLESYESDAYANGLTMSWAVTARNHPRGIGRAIHDATQDDPTGELHPKREVP